MAPVSFIALVTGYLFFVCLLVCSVLSFTGQMLPKPVTAFPILFSHGCVCVTGLHVNPIGILEWKGSQREG